ncbi:phage antirepressor N-terminal domain-containing protein [Rodentibacter caecimuris]|uniref:phage antirepressor N-terminal domain-containing protein n=1 Tax=Rodentibacter caecimuris TaxID=1796644 RepID=UPI0009870AAE|nr:antirepressor [Rodentibacter heylii]
MTTQLSTIQFHNQSLVTLEQNGIYYTAMKPICENIGLNWASQYQRIQRDEVLNQGIVIITTPTNSGEQQMLCLPIEYLNGWLFGIDINRCKPEIRETLIMYKKECYQALHDYWFKGKAERKTTTDERTGLRQAVSQLVSKKGLIYSDAYSLIHQRFNVEHIDELTPEQIGMAVEYVHKIALEGELIEPKKNEHYSFELAEHDLQEIAWDWFALVKCVEFTNYLLPALDSIQSKFAAQAHSIVSEYGSMLRRHQPLIQKLTADFKVEMWGDENWNRVLPTIRDNDVLRPNRRLGGF